MGTSFGREGEVNWQFTQAVNSISVSETQIRANTLQDVMQKSIPSILYFDDCHLTKAYAQAITANQRLQVLFLRDANAELGALPDLGKLPVVSKLYLDRCNVPASDIDALQQLRPRLQISRPVRRFGGDEVETIPRVDFKTGWTVSL